MAKHRTAYMKIRDAYKRNTGCRLTAEDVEVLYSDTAIRDRADMDADGHQGGMDDWVPSEMSDGE